MDLEAASAELSALLDEVSISTTVINIVPAPSFFVRPSLS